MAQSRSPGSEAFESLTGMDFAAEADQAVSQLRETAKWLLGTFAATFSALIAAVQLANFAQPGTWEGSLDSNGVAALLVIMAFVAIGAAVAAAASVMVVPRFRVADPKTAATMTLQARRQRFLPFQYSRSGTGPGRTGATTAPIDGIHVEAREGSNEQLVSVHSV
ncbi:MAG: hypothetical protein ACRDJC_14615, partial [Thermomicrobiales bacterium]